LRGKANLTELLQDEDDLSYAEKMTTLKGILHTNNQEEIIQIRNSLQLLKKNIEHKTKKETVSFTDEAFNITALNERLTPFTGQHIIILSFLYFYHGQDKLKDIILANRELFNSWLKIIGIAFYQEDINHLLHCLDLEENVQPLDSLLPRPLKKYSSPEEQDESWIENNHIDLPPTAPPISIEPQPTIEANTQSFSVSNNSYTFKQLRKSIENYANGKNSQELHQFFVFLMESENDIELDFTESTARELINYTIISSNKSEPYCYTAIFLNLLFSKKFPNDINRKLSE